MGNDMSYDYGGSQDSDDIVGNYKLKKKIGNGGFGHVYMAKPLHESTRATYGKHVAIKQLDVGDAITSVEIESFRRLPRHPNIVDIFDLFRQDGYIWLVMEYCEVGTMDSEMERNGLFSIATTRDLVMQISSALEACHRKGVTHADIKINNIVLTRQNSELVPKLIDFGISKVHRTSNRDVAKTNVRNIAVTPKCNMAPESRNRAHITDKTDIYSLGLLLFTMLSGCRLPNGKFGACITSGPESRAPFCMASRGAVKHTVKCDTPREFHLILLSMLNRSPHDRPSAWRLYDLLYDLHL